MGKGKGRVAIVTLGCKVNQFESDAIAEALEQRGWEVVTFGPGVDLTIINTCVVTARAEAEARRWIHRARRVNPEGLLLVAGCYPQIDPEGVISLGPDGVTGNQEKESIVEIVEKMLQGRRPVVRVGDIWKAKSPPALQTAHFRNHTRAFLKIQDGCNARCSYCIVPLARGRSRSVPVSQVLASLRKLAAVGYREVVLSGIHLGLYGQDLVPKTSLLELLRQIEDEQVPSRIRLSSLEPQEVTPELIDFISTSQRICPHLHLPLQSASDEILRRMDRPYTGEFFRELIFQIYERVSDVAIGVDVMVGFPGEDERAFQRTYDLLHVLPISYLHVFPFSPRPGTRAAEMPQQVQAQKKKERVKALRALSREKRTAFYSRYIGKTLTLLLEHRRQGGMLRGLSRNYIFCLLEGGNELMGQEVEVMLLGVNGERGLGKMVANGAGCSPKRA